jgi:MoxR-like ATPase
MANIWTILAGTSSNKWWLFKEKKIVAAKFYDSNRNYLEKPISFEEINPSIQYNTRLNEYSDINYFVDKIEKGDIIIAIAPTTTVLGIGTIESDYLPPNTRNNPSNDVEYKHSRRVDWHITERIDINNIHFSTFAEGGVVRELTSGQYETIKNAYLKVSQSYKLNIDAISKFFKSNQSTANSKAITPSKNVENLQQIQASTKNIILYGSPGTGKTYTVSQFAKLFLSKQLQSPITLEQRRQDSLKGLTWHEAIAFAMYVNYKKGKLFKVTELVKDDLVNAFWKTTKTQKLSNMIHAMLQIHTDVSVETVKYGISKRQPPYLFEKTKDGDWFLTDLGREYIEENLSEQLQNLKESTGIVADISKYLRFVTFHQSFAYEEFVEGIKPLTNELGEVSYKVVDGVFKQICRQAELDTDNRYLIIIDEINRANIAKVFGELITLIEDDKRIGARNELKVTLPYSQEEFGVPKNLYILGTMNTSDRSIALLDIALRRRFTFMELKPDPELLRDKVIDGIKLDRLLIQLNKRITLLIGRDYQIGHSYLMNVENLEDLIFIWYHRIVPLLQEYFYHDSNRLKAVIGNEFMQVPDISDIPDSLKEFRGNETQYEIAELQGDEFSAAILKLTGG